MTEVTSSIPPYNYYKNSSYAGEAFKGLLTAIGIYLILGNILGAVIMWINKDIFLYFQGFSELVFFMLPILFFARSSPLGFKDNLRLRKLPDYKMLILAIAGLIAIQFLVTGITGLQENLIPKKIAPDYKRLADAIQDTYKMLIPYKSYYILVVLLIVGAVVPALSEEVVFRGYFQKLVEQQWSLFKSILITSIIFALVHLNPIDFISLTCVGAYLGVLAYASRSLLLPILIHFLNNAFGFMLLYFSPEKIDNKFPSVDLATAFITFIFGGLILAAVSYLFLKRADVQRAISA